MSIYISILANVVDIQPLAATADAVNVSAIAPISTAPPPSSTEGYTSLELDTVGKYAFAEATMNEL